MTQVPPGHTVLLLVLGGEVRVAQGLPAGPSSWTHLPYASAADMQGEGEVQLHGPAKGSEASSGQVLLFSGQPIGAPVVWRGPFCGNSMAEVEQWARAYQVGGQSYGLPTWSLHDADAARITRYYAAIRMRQFVCMRVLNSAASGAQPEQ
ncbi:hypothetical protein V8C86DRAFT_3132419 [Haematococcus lacustris]